MLVLVTYDVRTSDPGGAARLRRVAKACRDFGQRVQYSVFEVEVDPAQWAMLKSRLEQLITERLINKQSLPVRERGSKPLTKVASSPAQGVAPRARARIETGDTRDNPRRSRVAPVRERGSKAFGRSGLA